MASSRERIADWYLKNGALTEQQAGKIIHIYDCVTKKNRHERFENHAALSEYLSKRTGISEYKVNTFLIWYLDLTPEEVAMQCKTVSSQAA